MLFVSQLTRRSGAVEAFILAIGLACLTGGLLAGLSNAAPGIPSKAFFEDYIAKKAVTFAEYRQKGIEPYLSMTLENNAAFRCVTSGGQEVDFEGYLEVYRYTFDRFVYDAITPVGVDIRPLNDDEILVTYTLRMEGKARAGAPYDVERENYYTFIRVKAHDEQKLKELSPKNLEKYFKEDEDKWIVVRIEYGF